MRALFIEKSLSMMTVVTPALFMRVTIVGACSSETVESPNVEPFAGYEFSLARVPPYFLKNDLKLSMSTRVGM